MCLCACVCTCISQIDDYNLVQYVPLDISDDDSVATTLAHIDRAIQWGEDAEPKVRLRLRCECGCNALTAPHGCLRTHKMRWMMMWLMH